MNVPARIQVVDAAALAEAGATLINELVWLSVAARGRASIALSGGRTPEPVYRALANTGTVPWDRVEIFFGDERAVPPDDERSNYLLARDALLSHVPLPPSAIHRMEAERPDLDSAAEEYGALLPERLDLILLGIGEDGHTASLFPRSAALDERIQRVIAVSTPEPPHRMTVTQPVIAAARETLVIAAGARKAGAVQRALLDDVSFTDCPARLVRDGRWLLDREAAGCLTGVP